MRKPIPPVVQSILLSFDEQLISYFYVEALKGLRQQFCAIRPRFEIVVNRNIYVMITDN